LKRRSVNFAPEARDDLLGLYAFIAEAAGPSIAFHTLSGSSLIALALISLPSADRVAMTSALICASLVSNDVSPSHSRLTI
jgi:hypothetical protein